MYLLGDTLIWDKSDSGFSQTKRPPYYQASKAKGEAILPGLTLDDLDISRQSPSNRFYKGGKVP